MLTEEQFEALRELIKTQIKLSWIEGQSFPGNAQTRQAEFLGGEIEELKKVLVKSAD